MSKQEYRKEDNTITTCNQLNYGELGEIINDGYEGIIITKTYDSIMAVYIPPNLDHLTAFRTCWGKADFKVRLLSKNEKVVLSND